MKIEAETRKIISLSNELDNNNNNNRQSDMSASTSLLPASIFRRACYPLSVISYFSLLQCFVSIFKPLIYDSKLHRHILTWIISSSRKPKG